MSNDGGGSITSCKRLAAESESGVVQQYYALVLTDAQQQTFDLAVTDGQHAWRGTGLSVSRPPGFSADEAWARALELLVDVNPASASAKPAALKAQQLQSGELQFTWSWAREVGAGRHVMKLPDPTAAAAAGALPGQQQQQPAGVLLQQQPPHATIAHILDTLVASYGHMQSFLSVSSGAQSSLSSSLEVLRGTLDSQAAAHKERERELYLKFTMLLNQKTRQLAREHEVVKQLAAELDRLKGEAEADTDTDEGQHQAAAAAAGDAEADTEPGSDDGPPAAAAAGRQPARSGAAAAAGRAGSIPGRGSAVIPDSEDPAEDPTAAAAGGGGGGVTGGGVGVDDMDLDSAATQPLDMTDLGYDLAGHQIQSR